MSKFGTYGPCYGKPAHWFDDPKVGPVNIAYEPEALSLDGIKILISALIDAQMIIRQKDQRILLFEQSLSQLQDRYTLLKKQSFVEWLLRLCFRSKR